jgi:hypothetical protein
MRDHGHRVVFATPSGRTARADPKMVTGEGLGTLSPLLKADANAGIPQSCGPIVRCSNDVRTVRAQRRAVHGAAVAGKRGEQSAGPGVP